MQDTLNFFLDLNNLHWGGSAYQWFFYAGILLTLILEKRRMFRIVFGWVPLLYLVFMFNPACIKLLNLAGVSKPAYFTRLFSFMPLMYVIARGFTFLLHVNNAWLKLVGVSLICTVVCLVGKNVYLEPWLTKAENTAKVPQSTLDILNAIDVKHDQSVSIAAIDADKVYIRQVEDAVMPYGRFGGELAQLIEADPPDVQQVMERAGQQSVDYVVAHRTGSVIAAFLKNRYRPFALTQDYAIYRVENVPRIWQTLNEKRQVAFTTNCDSAGKPTATIQGYTSTAFGYDANGNTIWETYLDREGKPYRLFEGYSAIITERYSDGRKKTMSYLDSVGNPVIVDGRYKTKYDYNRDKQVVRETYYDTDGNVIAAVGEGLPVGADCLRFYQRTSGARRDANNHISFETTKEGNRFSAVLFQVWNGLTNEYLLAFGGAAEVGRVSGEYIHQMPSGLYKIAFRGHTNLKDEHISSLEYLTEGETLYYSYRVDVLQDNTVEVSDLYIGRKRKEEY